jgi:dephospho-CoA kinase
MLVVGLTGGIGSGKSLVAEIFSHLNIPVYNSDEKAKALMNLPELMAPIKSEFGDEAYTDNRLNRSYLSKIVFNNSEELRKLNNIVHPAVRKDFMMWHEQQDSLYTLREAAILFESGASQDCDKIITISANEETRIARVMKRDNSVKVDVQARMLHQWSDEKRKELSDFEIHNDERNMLIPQVIRIHEQLINILDKR